MRAIGLGDMMDAIKDAFLGAELSIGDAFGGEASMRQGGILSALKAPFQTFIDWLGYIWTLAKAPLEIAYGLLNVFLTGEGAALETALLAPVNAFVNFITGMWEDYLKTPFEQMVGFIDATFIAPVNALFGSIVEFLATNLGHMLNMAADAVAEVPGFILGAFLPDSGKPLIAGLRATAEALLAGSVAGGGDGAIVGRQLGGVVLPGESYVVGERGPELFMPSERGRVLPNAALAGTGGVTLNVSLNVDGAGLDEAALARRLTRELDRVVRRQARAVGVEWQ